MLSNRLRGTWDRFIGFNRALWGEVSGSGEMFSAGQQQRLIGWLECERDLNHHEAARQTEEIPH